MAEQIPLLSPQNNGDEDGMPSAALTPAGMDDLTGQLSKLGRGSINARCLLENVEIMV